MHIWPIHSNFKQIHHVPHMAAKECFLGNPDKNLALHTNMRSAEEAEHRCRVAYSDLSKYLASASPSEDEIRKKEREIDVLQTIWAVNNEKFFQSLPRGYDRYSSIVREEMCRLTYGLYSFAGQRKLDKLQRVMQNPSKDCVLPANSAERQSLLKCAANELMQERKEAGILCEAIRIPFPETWGNCDWNRPEKPKPPQKQQTVENIKKRSLNEGGSAPKRVKWNLASETIVEPGNKAFFSNVSQNSLTSSSYGSSKLRI